MSTSEIYRILTVHVCVYFDMFCNFRRAFEDVHLVAAIGFDIAESETSEVGREEGH